MHANLPLAQLALRDDPSFRLRRVSGFYDGAYFYAQARDPLATGEAHRLLAEAPYYWGHPGYGWVAWVASIGGHPSVIPDALLAVGLLSVAVAAALASLLAAELGWTAWGGLTVALNPGAVFAVANDTSESLGIALLLLALLAHVRGRRFWALTCFALLCFVKEPLVLVPLAVAVWELWRRRTPVSAAAVLPVSCWWLYLRLHLGAFPFGEGSSRLSVPVRGWEQALLGAASQSWDPAIDTAQLGQAAVPLLVVSALALVVVAAYALRLRTPVDAAFLVLAALYVCIASIGVQYPKDLIRELAFVIALAPLVLAARVTGAGSPFARRCPPARLRAGRRSGS
jgi:hypothetical protein